MRMSLADFLAHQAKHAAKKAGATPADDGPESQLQGAVRKYCADQKWVCLCGSMAERTHRTVGELDFTIAMPKARVIFVETKRKGGKPTAEQQTMIACLRWLGHEAYLVDSFQQFLNIVNPAKS